MASHSLVYKHGQRYGLLPRGEEGNPLRLVRQSTTGSFEPIILSLAEAFAIRNQLDLMKRTLVLVIAATALRISEILALQWKDVDSEGQQIQVTKSHLTPTGLLMEGDYTHGLVAESEGRPGQ